MLNEAHSCRLTYHTHIAWLTQGEEITSFDYHAENKKIFMLFSDLVSYLETLSHTGDVTNIIHFQDNLSLGNLLL